MEVRLPLIFKPLTLQKQKKNYKNNNLLIEDNKVEKSSIFTKYALYKS